MKGTIIEQLRGYFDKDFRKKIEETDSAKKLLKKLKKRRKDLEKQRASVTHPKSAKKLAKQIKILREQEKRAIKLIKGQA